MLRRLRNKKVIIVAVVATVLLVVGIGTTVLADTESADNTTAGQTLTARVAAILGIDQQTLEDAFAQARSEMRAEALDKRLQTQVNAGRITQEQADQYKAWLEAKPDIPFGFGSEGHQEFYGMDGMHRFGGMRGFRGMPRFGGMYGHGGIYGPGGADIPTQ